MSDLTTTFDITGLDELERSTARVLSGSMGVQRDEIHRVGERYVRALRDDTPKGKGEANGRARLVDSYQIREFYAATQGNYDITNAAPSLQWVINGRGPVEAKEGKMLRFVIDGQVFYRKRVGPVAPNPFDARVAAAMRGDLDGLGNRIGDRIVRLFEEG